MHHGLLHAVLLMIQLALFGAVLWGSAERGHESGQAAAQTIAPGLQVLIGLLLLGVAGEEKQGGGQLYICMIIILAAYHTVILPVCLATPGGSTETLLWEGAIGGMLISLNHTVSVIAYTNDPNSNSNSNPNLTGIQFTSTTTKRE